MEKLLLWNIGTRIIYGGDGYGSIFHPDTWWRYIEYALTHRKGGISLYVKTITTCVSGKVLPQC